MGDPVPDRTTIARYRSSLETQSVREVFELFIDRLAAADYVAKDAQMVDSSFVLVPIQRNTRDKNKTLKDDEVPETWQEDTATAKLRQKDTDTRWTKKHGKSYYGYKNYICVDVKHKLVRGYIVTPASDHASVVAEAVVVKLICPIYVEKKCPVYGTFWTSRSYARPRPNVNEMMSFHSIGIESK